MLSAETPKLIELSDHVYVRQEIDNLGWIDMGEYIIVVDALEKPDAADDVFQKLSATIGDKPIKYLLNTHIHYDHIALNDIFQERCGTTVINHKITEIPAEGRCFAGKTCRVLMLPLPNLHTANDCVVWVEPDRTLFTGDLFGWGIIPLCRALTSETANRLRQVYKRMIDFNAEHVVPGHGPVCSTAELQRWLDYFNWLIETAVKVQKANPTEAEIQEIFLPPSDMKDWWRFVEWKHADSVKKVTHAARRNRL